VARALRVFHVASIAVWAVMIPVSLATGWATSTTFISVLSIYALVLAHFAGLGASRVEKKQDEEEP
jgi:hypothetical protein